MTSQPLRTRGWFVWWSMGRQSLETMPWTPRFPMMMRPGDRHHGESEARVEVRVRESDHEVLACILSALPGLWSDDRQHAESLRIALMLAERVGVEGLHVLNSARTQGASSLACLVWCFRTEEALARRAVTAAP